MWADSIKPSAQPIHYAGRVAAGGCFPLILRGTGCIGTITGSGLPQREGHNLVVVRQAEMLG